MANAEQIKTQVASHAEGDDPKFHAVALQIAAREARAGRVRVADEFRRSVEDAKRRSSSSQARARILSLAQPRGELAGLLLADHPAARLWDLVLAGRGGPDLGCATPEGRMVMAMEQPEDVSPLAPSGAVTQAVSSPMVLWRAE